MPIFQRWQLNSDLTQTQQCNGNKFLLIIITFYNISSVYAIDFNLIINFCNNAFRTLSIVWNIFNIYCHFIMEIFLLLLLTTLFYKLFSKYKVDIVYIASIFICLYIVFEMGNNHLFFSSTISLCLYCSEYWHFLLASSSLSNSFNSSLDSLNNIGIRHK